MKNLLVDIVIVMSLSLIASAVFDDKIVVMTVAFLLGGAYGLIRSRIWGKNE